MCSYMLRYMKSWSLIFNVVIFFHSTRQPAADAARDSHHDNHPHGDRRLYDGWERGKGTLSLISDSK